MAWQWARRIVASKKTESNIPHSAARLSGAAYKRSLQQQNGIKAMTLSSFNLNPRDDDRTYRTVAELLKETHSRFELVYRGFLANHLAHDLFSLYKMKASPERIRACYDQHAEYLEAPAPSQHKINESNWTHYLGKDQYKLDYRDHFDSEIASVGFNPTVDKYMPPLIPALMSAAFHPFIHLGFALEFNHPLVLSEALGYWCFSVVKPKTLSDYCHSRAKRGLLDVVRAALTDPELLKRTKDDDKFGVRAYNVQQDGGGEIINTYVQSWKISNGNNHIDYTTINERVKELRNAVLQAFLSGAGSGTRPEKLDFFLCHGVTSAHALHCVIKFLQEHLPDSLNMQVDMLRYYLQGILITCFAQGGVQILTNVVDQVKLDQDGDEEWKRVFELAINNTDDHVPKAVCSFKHDELDYGFNEGLYLKAAKVTVARVPHSGCWEFHGVGYKHATKL
ncbi:hypothetical protein SeMB42_g04790 [Synchytrium endobioticum]|uniref:Uncharacterized protein n=1 Tax=Synchytrium endobioticum TaxID=286115 RepID=A0A507DC09_9FUNG|nr:hypothetical protein SeMB42_g04790 [Synchytrium endobioticum]TPX49123.1 hypothetical protein SeLEV6574_g01628 [Synchytrium endobioticum]